MWLGVDFAKEETDPKEGFCQTGPDAWRYVTPRCPGGTTNV